MEKETASSGAENMKTAIIEIGGSHDECLYSQIKFLKSVDNSHVTLICDEKIKNRVDYFNLVDETHVVKIRKGFREFIDLYKLRKFLISGGFNKVIFNTAQGSRIKKLLFFPYTKQIEFIGVLHNIKKLNGSFSQKQISKKVRKYFILNDYLLEEIEQKNMKALDIGTFYPIFFPEYPELALEKKEDEIWVCVPGQVELKRRDYECLFNSIEKTGIADNVKLILLGRCEHPSGDGAYIKEKLETLNIKNNFLIWDDFVDTDLFYHYIKHADFILPLIHPDHKSFVLYKNQISGAFNLAFGYKKPLLMEATYSRYDDFKNNSIFYDKENIFEVINSLELNHNKDSYNEKKWTFEYQSDRYLELINKV